MAQYYQIVGQDQPIQTVTLEELRQYYPNLTCVESNTGVQYVINNQDDSTTQFSSQQVLLSSEQQIVLNSGEAPQQIIVDQSQISYTQPQQYSVQTVQENELVTDYQQPTEMNNTQPQQQIYYTTTKQQIIQSSPTPLINQQLDQRQIATQQIINTTRVVTQHVNQSPIRQMVPHQVNNSHLMVQRRMSIGQTQPQIVTPPNIPRPVLPNAAVRLQYTTQEQIQEPPRVQNQPQPVSMDQDDNQIVVNDGRYITLAQFKQELSQNQQENVNVHQNVVANQGVQNCVDKAYKQPPPKRVVRRQSTNNRGGKARGGRGAQQNNRLLDQSSPQSTNHLATTPKPFQQLTNQNQSKPIITYQAKSIIHKQTPPSPIIQQQRSLQPLHPPIMQHQLQSPQGIQQLQPLRPMQPVMQHGIQQVTMQVQPVLQQQQAVYSPSLNNRSQPLIPLSPHAHNGHAMQTAVYSPPASQTQHQYLDDSSSSLSDEYKDSARMLVCLENGEQRLITFTLPKESCTVQDLLEQVGVPFNADTKIECISNPGSEIDYIVNVGAVTSSSFPADAQQVLTVDNLGESQECIVSQSGAVIPVTDRQAEDSPKSKSPEKPPEPPKEVPKFISGSLAVCNHCGYLSEDFNRCQRCKTKLPDDVKSITTRSDKQNEDKKDTKNKSIIPKASLKATSLNQKSVTPKPARGKKPKAQDLEPVVLTLSSDDEDTVSKPVSGNNMHLTSRLLDNSVTLSAIQKEPVISEECDPEIENENLEEGIFGGGNEDLKMNTPIFSTSLPCRTVRIGSYRFVPKEEVVITSLGIKIYVPVIGDQTQTYKLFVPIKYIIKVLGNFSKALPVLFFYVTPSIGCLIRKKIKMEEGSEYYFDPLSKEEPFKRITLLPEVIYEETKGKIKEIFLNTPYKMLEELTAKEANDILIRTCPREGGIQKPIQSVTTSFTETRQLLIYPPGKGGIAINAEDYLCLAQDQFLNDVIIDFYLKYLVTDVLAATMQQKVYIFSSFFYKRLTTKPAKASKRSNPYEVDPTLTPAEKRHCRVKNWTKNVNIFEKDYVIIPINENSHWFLAIICYPGLEGCRSMIDSSKIVKEPVKEKKKNTTITIGNTTITTLKVDEKGLNKSIDKPIKCDDEEGSDRDEAEGDESELEESDAESNPEEFPLEKRGPSIPEPIKQPCILIFDSLAGASRSRVVATLRDYLTCEHRAKLNSSKSFTKDVIKGACPKVPQQMNFTDCGLYVLQYVESFFKDPITDYHIPIKMLKNWFEEIVVTRKREEISNLIRELMLENNKDPSVLPDITFPTLNGELISSMEPNFSEAEEEEEEEETEHTDSQELGSSQESERAENSLQQLQMYNSDSSNESHAKSTESSPLVSNATISTTSTFVVSNSAVKPDLNCETKKSNRETMSYLKSKRILRHKNNDSNEVKKQKKDE